MARVRSDGASVSFKCPGCGDEHRVPVQSAATSWSWNGSVDRPTLFPSLMVRAGHFAPHWKQGDACWCGKDYPFQCYQCHSFIRDGKIEFLADCSHKLAGQMVDLPEVING